VWGAAGEVFIQKAAAVNLGDAGRVARAELLGAAGLLGVLLVQPTQSPVLGLGLALLAQHLLQGLTLRRSIGPLLTDLPRSGWTAHILMSQVLAFVAANVDYVVAWWILGAGPLGLYSLAFRIGNLPQAQVSNVAGRLALVDLARDQSTERYVAFVNRLFTLGVLLMALTIGCAPFLPVLGQRWDAAVPVLVLVSFGTPWRIIMGTAGSVAIAAGAARRLSRWETVRVIWTAAMLAPAAGLGSNPFVAATTISTAWSSTVLHFLAASASGRRLPRWLIPAALATSVVAIVGAMMLPEPS
jgi:O-antigen/teichoic acid export membrane protein